ncbi:S49 family peptidase [Sphingobacterium daejeonense]|uniref:S49 family peptidase n=1 Tax=Sphingobacterium daejeonense TaxID=371142 RepID=UPI0010C3F426|nr:S49 family peptidase [Sphingobacterium daejeonense]VTQ01765.1 Protease 4 [Sphingobacterium daejeonense]
MQRRLEANWQQHLISAILRGQFMISPEFAFGLGPQLEGILKSTSLYENNIQILDKIDIMAYEDDEEHDAENIGDEGAKVIVLPVKGTMLKYGTLCSYGMIEIASYIKHFASKENVSAIVLDIDSGGGAVNAVPPLLEAIQFVKELGKPIVAHCDAACSAAYWTASACDHIFSNNDVSSVFGSVGVMLSFLDMVPFYEKQGAKFHEVYSELSDHKNLAFQNLLKGEYDQIRKEMLDPMAIKFQDTVKSNRLNLSLETSGILAGATFNGQRSVDLGLADRIGTLKDAIDYASVQSWGKNK